MTTSERGNESSAAAAVVPAHDERCLLVATNGSAESQAALRFGAALAEREELALRILTVVETLPMLAHQGGAVMQHGVDVDEARDLLARARADIAPPSSRVAAVTAMIAGPRGATIADAAREWNARFVILGESHHGAFERLLAGDTLTSVLHQANTPVIAVPVSCGVLPRNGLAAVDFGDASLRAAHAAAHTIGNGTLHLVHVRAEIDVPVTEAWPLVYNAGATTLLNELAERIRDGHPDIQTKQYVLRGHAPDVLLRFASEMSIDLLALGQHGHGSLEHLVFGSVVRAVAQHAQCTLLIAPPGAER